MRTNRIMIKASGQALAGPRSEGIDPPALGAFADQVINASATSQVAIVVGGGNIFRGRDSAGWSIDRVDADNVGMLGTAINALLLRAAIASRSEREVRVMSALPMAAVAEPYVRLRAIRHLEKRRIVIMACGIGQPFVTTDYPAVQRALEVKADLLLAAKHGVDGVYDADPNVDPSAARFDTLGFDEVIERGLTVMDPSAFLLAREHALGIHVFDSARPDAIEAVLRGDAIGTRIS